MRWLENPLLTTSAMMVISTGGEDTGGGGAGGGPIIDISNNINNACLRSMANQVINKNITTVINGMIQHVFNGTLTVNLNYSDSMLLGPGVCGYTPPVPINESGILNLEVHLDGVTLPNYSQEFIAVVVMHQSIHAYLTSIGSHDENQHIAIMNVFVSQMAADLKQMFPNIPENDAKNLALTGLYMTEAFKTQIASNIGAQGSFDATSIAYSIGSLGTRCNNN